ncbi:MAG: hypothetical protein R3D71_05860 [Rickettsiales bacterium]
MPHTGLHITNLCGSPRRGLEPQRTDKPYGGNNRIHKLRQNNKRGAGFMILLFFYPIVIFLGWLEVGKITGDKTSPVAEILEFPKKEGGNG